MKYINFKYDLDNLIYYNELKCKYCFDQMLYNFKDKYGKLNNEFWQKYIKQYEYEYENNINLEKLIKLWEN